MVDLDTDCQWYFLDVSLMPELVVTYSDVTYHPCVGLGALVDALESVRLPLVLILPLGPNLIRFQP